MGECAVLCVDDEQSILNSLRRLLRCEDYQLLIANSGAEGLEILSQQPVHVVISDLNIPQMSGAEFLEQVSQTYPQTVRLALSGSADAEMILDAVNKGQIYQYLLKPWRDDELRLSIRQALASYDLMSENRTLTDLANQQAQELQKAYEEIKQWNQTLEQRVEEQTRELQEAYDHLKQAQAQLETLERCSTPGGDQR